LSKKIDLPLADEVVAGLRAGDNVLLSGTIYAARDTAHQRLVALLKAGKSLPFDLRGQTFYYMGPSPARPPRVIGSAGPTTSVRMDSFCPALMEAGLKGMIGKGNRTLAVREAIRKYRAVYFAAIGGAGALLSRCIKKAEIVAFPELGAEAIRCLQVEDFPATVINDIYGADLYEEGKAKFKKNLEQRT